MDTDCIRIGKTASPITARVDDQMGRGAVQPYRCHPGGRMTPEGAPVEVWSKFGLAISEGVWVDYARVDGLLEIFGGDASGVA